MWEPLVLRSETCFLLKLTCHLETEKGFYTIFRLDRQSGDLTPAGVFPMGTSPSCLAVNPTETGSTRQMKPIGGMEPIKAVSSAFAINASDGKPYQAQHRSFRWCGSNLRQSSSFAALLLVANYFSGSVSVLPVRTDGRLGEPVCVVEDQGDPGLPWQRMHLEVVTHSADTIEPTRT